MAIHELRPPEFDQLPPSASTVYFIGPIEAAPDWQAEGISILRELHIGQQTLCVANPRPEPSESRRIPESEIGKWQRYYLRRAAKFGVVVTWLAAPDKSQEFSPNTPYAQKSHIEVGRVLGWHDIDRSVRLVLGIEPGHPGDQAYFRSCAKEEGLTIYDNLPATCQAALTRLS